MRRVCRPGVVPGLVARETIGPRALVLLADSGCATLETSVTAAKGNPVKAA